LRPGGLDALDELGAPLEPFTSRDDAGVLVLAELDQMTLELLDHAGEGACRRFAHATKRLVDRGGVEAVKDGFLDELVDRSRHDPEAAAVVLGAGRTSACPPLATAVLHR